MLIDGRAPSDWYVARPTTVAGWRARAVDVRESVPADWLERLSLAFGASGAARDRLERASRGAGVIVTTGQQPGLFGGPVYTWSKAISALELADAIERETGIPTAPVFWAATDDADFPEASDTWISRTGGAERLVMHGPAQEGLPMADHPLGDVREELLRLSAAAGSTVDPSVLDAAALAYHPGATVGGAYLTLLRALLQPLGIAVLDASHPALLDAERPWLTRALTHGAVVAEALRARASELRAQGHEPQVADVEGLSLVFGREAGRKVRVPLRLADEVVARGALERLSPNVLLRPVVERAVLPTVAYVAGPGEISYFAQVSAVADALGAARPLVVPRWSCTLVEPHIAARMAARGVTAGELADPHAVEGRLARRDAPAGITAAVAGWRQQLEGGAAALRSALAEAPGLLSESVVDGAQRQMLWRAERLERRLVAALKRRDEAMREDVATMRGALYPGGQRQERALNLLPVLARHGLGVLEAMRARARGHAAALVHGDPIPVDPA
jgi:bacillithiol biosynthesis cysteine-adding enzyme BshC